jgi:hypothetical protein
MVRGDPLTRNVRAKRAHSDLSPLGRGGPGGSISAKQALATARAAWRIQA